MRGMVDSGQDNFVLPEFSINLEACRFNRI